MWGQVVLLVTVRVLRLYMCVGEGRRIRDRLRVERILLRGELLVMLEWT